MALRRDRPRSMASTTPASSRTRYSTVPGASPNYTESVNTPITHHMIRATPANTNARQVLPAPHSDHDNAALDDALNEVIMAVDMRGRGVVGCAYYVAADEKLYFMEDVKMGGPETVEALHLFIEPTLVVVSSRIDESVLDKLDPERINMGDDGSTACGMPPLCLTRPNSEFAYEQAKNKLINLDIGGREGPRVTFVVPGDVVSGDDEILEHEDGAFMGRQGSLLRLSGWIDLDSRLTVGCAGALISYIQRKRAATFLPGDPAAQTMHKITTIEMFSLRDSMFVNTDTLLSLQIVRSESHPHSHNQGPTKANSGSKEGLSVYGLFHHLARTPQGKYLLRQYFLRPSQSTAVIDQRLDTIGVLLRPDNSSVLEELIKHLSKIKNMRQVMISLRKGISAGNGKGGGVARSIWASTRLFVYHALKIKDSFDDMMGGENLLIRIRIMEVFEGQVLAVVGRCITKTIDFEASQQHRRTVVLAGVDEGLDSMKRTYDGLEDLLAQVATHISKGVPAELNIEINVIFFPQIGFLIAVPLDVATVSGLWEGGEDDPWEKMFTTEERAYYKNGEMTEMDEYLGDVYGRICDREIEITHELAEKILEYEEKLTIMSDICGEVDSLVALAQGAQRYKLSRPRMTEANVIKIKGGRHLLQELVVPNYVPNDTFVDGGSGTGDDTRVSPAAATPAQQGIATEVDPCPSIVQDTQTAPSMILLTGPNYSGKSVYLKQVAMIVYMAHVGSFVPAAWTEIGITDKILTRVATRESVSRVQSTFMLDLQQICVALNLVTRRSLLIIDEFGKGTESHDGAGLAAGVFSHLLNRGVHCPKVLGATHFHEIFEIGLFNAQARLGFGHFEVVIDDDASHKEDQVTYLYNYKAGRSTSSYGTVCAAVNGIAPEIIRRAEELILLAARGEDLVTACANLTDDEAEDLREAENAARKFLAADLEGVDKSLLENILEEVTTVQK